VLTINTPNAPLTFGANGGDTLQTVTGNRLDINSPGSGGSIFIGNDTAPALTNIKSTTISLIGNVGIGTSTPPSLLSVVKEPTGNGTVATTTVDFGDYATTTSSVCFNTKNTAGTAISFYFVGTSMVVESNRCR
jgi:hypothetical protein